MRWELGAKYAPPHGWDGEWFGVALAELRDHVAGPVTIRLVFRRDGDSRLHTIAGEVADAPPRCAAVRPDASRLVTVSYVDQI
jgi:hypothetical protein